MRQYNVEIFDRDFNLVSHTNVNRPSYSVDYLAPVTNEVTLLNCDASKGDYIRIHSGDDEFFGIITAVTNQTEETVTITYSDFLTVFNVDVLFDTDLQGTSTLEVVIAGLIDDMFISNSDDEQNITGLTVETSSSTPSWGFNLKSDTEGMHHCIINFYSSIIVRALEKYSVVIKVTPDIQNQAITLTIGTISDATKYIEADLPNVVERNVVIKETDKDVNKLTVYSTADYSTTATYYRHSDDSYDTSDSDRITPVVFDIQTVSPTETDSFATLAASAAADLFGGIEYNNLIELIVANDDTLVAPADIDIGQIVHVISKGATYTSILTGKTVSDRTQLTFGTIRLDLTKIIKRRYG